MLWLKKVPSLSSLLAMPAHTVVIICGLVINAEPALIGISCTGVVCGCSCAPSVLLCPLLSCTVLVWSVVAAVHPLSSSVPSLSCTALVWSVVAAEHPLSSSVPSCPALFSFYLPARVCYFKNVI